MWVVRAAIDTSMRFAGSTAAEAELDAMIWPRRLCLALPHCNLDNLVLSH
jgi:hypothetical protein